jgi:hypothetical protein
VVAFALQRLVSILDRSRYRDASGMFYAFVFEQGALNVARTQGAVGVIDAGYRIAAV